MKAMKATNSWPHVQRGEDDMNLLDILFIRTHYFFILFYTYI